MRTITYQEHSFDDIIAYFVKGFTMPTGTSLVTYDTFYDLKTGTVLFKLVVDDGERP
jgi:hypothetical protein